jgi:hypothetical protein
MSPDVVKIELIGGDGTIIVFKNGQPVGSYFASYSLPPDLEEFLKEHLVRYYYPDDPIV